MSKIIKRLINWDIPTEKSIFLWGPRKTGKSYWIANTLKPKVLIDLLKTDVFAEYVSRPALLRERFQDHRGLIVIDEIQKIPALLDEVHWLIENSKCQFLMTGSSSWKLRRGHANLLAGRAWRRMMMPLSMREVEGWDLERAMFSGLLPPHFLSQKPAEDLRAYIADYLKEEIAAEAKEQNIPAFAEFLRVAALTSSELLNYTNVAREAGISQRVVRSYFEILEDTYLGFRLAPWRKSKTRRLIQAEKFYFFDVGVANFLARRHPVIGSVDFGKSFENYILMEMRAFLQYQMPDCPLAYYRSASGIEIDFMLGNREVAIEVKGSARVHEGDWRHFKSLKEDGPVKKCIIVSLEKEPRRISPDTFVLPYQDFIEKLWNKTLLS